MGGGLEHGSKAERHGQRGAGLADMVGGRPRRRLTEEAIDDGAQAVLASLGGTLEELERDLVAVR